MVNDAEMMVNDGFSKPAIKQLYATLHTTPAAQLQALHECAENYNCPWGPELPSGSIWIYIDSICWIQPYIARLNPL